MIYRLRDGLSCCICNRQTVFLDLPRDRYFRLGQHDDARFQLWHSGGVASQADADRLVEIGILVAGRSAQPPDNPAPPVPPCADLAANPRQKARLLDIGRCLLAQHRARSTVRRGALAATLQAIASEPKLPSPVTGEALASARRVAVAFASMPLTFAKAGQCLPRALAALTLCRAAGVAPILIFGVRLEPFAAHCWLQLGSEVVVGDLEQARMFTPILAVA